MKEKKRAELHNWAAFRHESGDIFLIGQATDHPGFYQGEWVRTSAVEDCNLASSDAFTKNTYYRLEAPFVGDPKEIKRQAERFPGMYEAELLDWHEKAAQS